MNLLERTRRLLQGLTPPSPPKVQYYSVACPEGHRLRGERTEGYQALRCPTCGGGVFILPRSPLPEPVAPETRAPRPIAAPERHDEPIRLTDPPPAPSSDVEPGGPSTPIVDGEIEWLDPAPGDASSGVSSSTPRDDSGFFDRLDVPDEPAPGARPRSRPRTRRTAPTDETEVREPRLIVEVPRRSFAAWVVQHRNPLIFVAVPLIVAGTVGYRVWRSKFQDLPQVVEIGREQGLPALDAGDFDTAHQLLSAAKRAVDALDGAVEGAAEIRQGADEAALYTSLTPELLERILVEASADEEEWSTRFNTHYKGRAILLDAIIEEAPDPVSGVGSYDLDYRILPNGEGNRPNLRVGRIDLTGFQLFEQSRKKKGDHVQFGARLASFTHDRENRIWLVGLEPDSGVFLTHSKALEAIGRPTVDEGAGGEAAP